MEEKETKGKEVVKTTNKKAKAAKAKTAKAENTKKSVKEETTKKARPKSAPNKTEKKKFQFCLSDVKIDSGEEYGTGIHEKKGKYAYFQLEKNKSMNDFANYFTLKKADPSYLFTLYMYENGDTIIEINMKNKEKRDVIIDVKMGTNTKIRLLRQINPQIHKNYKKSFGEILAEIQ